VLGDELIFIDPAKGEQAPPPSQEGEFVPTPRA
jgi:hypothetical protein